MKYICFCFAALFGLMVFQNCGGAQSATFSSALRICDGVSCELTALTTKPAVSTVLLALGDTADSELVVRGASAQLIAEAIIRYTSPLDNPKILLVKDHASGSESVEDTLYIKDSLLRRYDVTFMNEATTGLTAADVEGFDLIWFNNPGSPMGSEATKQLLLSFPGGVVLQGDDLSRGEESVDDREFGLEDLTGLEYIDNGTQVKCGGKSYDHDNNGGEQFRLTVNPEKIPGVDESTLEFRYGNDIDNTKIVRSDLEVLAYAVGGPEDCTEQRPAIVRYFK